METRQDLLRVMNMATTTKKGGDLKLWPIHVNTEHFEHLMKAHIPTAKSLKSD